MLYDDLRLAAQDCHVTRFGTLLLSEVDLEPLELVNGQLLTTQIHKPACRTALSEHLNGKSSFQLARDARFMSVVRNCDRAEAEAMLRRHAVIDPLLATDGVSPLERAVVAGYSDIVSLFGRERDLDGKLPHDLLATAMQNTPSRQLVVMIRTLLGAGASVDYRAQNTETLLGLAIGLESRLSPGCWSSGVRILTP